jgi:hypothetical protein
MDVVLKLRDAAHFGKTCWWVLLGIPYLVWGIFDVFMRRKTHLNPDFYK